MVASNGSLLTQFGKELCARPSFTQPSVTQPSVTQPSFTQPRFANPQACLRSRRSPHRRWPVPWRARSDEKPCVLQALIPRKKTTKAMLPIVAAPKERGEGEARPATDGMT